MLFLHWKPALAGLAAALVPAAISLADGGAAAAGAITPGGLPPWLQDSAFLGLLVWVLRWQYESAKESREIQRAMLDRVDAVSLMMAETQDQIFLALAHVSGVDLDDDSDSRIRQLSAHYQRASKSLASLRQLIEQRMSKETKS